MNIKNSKGAGPPLNPALGRQRQADLYEFNASLVYIASSIPVSKKKKKKKKNKMISGVVVI